MNYWGEGNDQNPPATWFDRWGWIVAVLLVCFILPALIGVLIGLVR